LVHVLLKSRIDQFNLSLSADCSLEFIFDLARLVSESVLPIAPLKGRDIFPLLLPTMTSSKNGKNIGTSSSESIPSNICRILR
jgi:hypothetical protein